MLNFKILIINTFFKINNFINVKKGKIKNDKIFCERKERRKLNKKRKGKT